MTTDYAIRVVLYLAAAQRKAEQMAQEKGLCDEHLSAVVSSTKICGEMGIPWGMMHRITRILKDTDIIREKRGVTGGFELIKSAEDITILDITRAFEKTMTINKCLEDDRFCSSTTAHQCLVREFYTKLQHTINEMMSKKVSDFL
ncbi:MAG: Rrf2 family transcriptional regulator [Nitrososphaerota archaeon]|nr:Rrf2 family transcriptional regulator [Nitrososphaerota archaeon]